METYPFSGESLPGEILLAKMGDSLLRPAMIDGDRALTYQDLLENVTSLVRELGDLGVVKGDRVALISGRNLEYVAGFLAITLRGAIAVPIDGSSGQGRRQFILDDTQPVLILHPGETTASEELPTPQGQIRWDTTHRRLRLVAPNRLGTNQESSWSILGTEAAGTVAVILYTSGSTGQPKGVPLTHRQLLHIAQVLADRGGITECHRELSLSPLSHSGGWQRVSATLHQGGCVVLGQGLPSVPGLLEDVRDHKITGFFTPPPLLKALLKTDPKRVKAGLAGCLSIETASAPLPPSDLEKLLNLLPHTQFIVQYGLTECSRALMLDARAHPDKLHTVGRPTSGVEVSLFSEKHQHHDAKPGQLGEILLRGPQRVNRYWNGKDRERERFHEDWLRTGDMGIVDEDGFLTLRGRRDDRINCGGYSFFPAEVEVELREIEGVEELIVAGVPDPQGFLTEVPWVFVVKDKTGAWSPKSFHEESRRRLPSHMIPRRIVELSSIPHSSTGKPDRRRITELYGPDSLES